jgi:hypothetical protein
MVLGHSRMLWGRFVLHQDLQTLLRYHSAAFEAPQGRPDRLSVAATGPRRQRTQIAVAPSGQAVATHRSSTAPIMTSARARFLNRLAGVMGTAGGERFRNANGVAMKLENFRRFDSAQEGKGLRGGGKGEEEVWAVFAGDAERLRSAAAGIRATVSALEDAPEEVPEEGEEAEEGEVLTRLHRDP